jgi:hypothetical protein
VQCTVLYPTIIYYTIYYPILFSAAQCSTVQCNAVQRSAVQWSAVQCYTALHWSCYNSNYERCACRREVAYNQELRFMLFSPNVCCSEGPWFEFRPKVWLSNGFIQSLQVNVVTVHLIDFICFFPNSFKIIFLFHKTLNETTHKGRLYIRFSMR